MRRLWFSRFLIILVTAWNLQAALAFFIWPQAYAPSFELGGAPGFAAVRGIAVLFVMWNVPYVLAAWHPTKHLASLKEAIAMQTIGVAGETAIFLSLYTQHATLQHSILRFIWFDAAGLVALCTAWYFAIQSVNSAD